MTDKTQSPLERAADAIGQNLYVESNIEIARAVLMAIREPSEAMASKGGEVGPWYEGYDTKEHSAENAKDVWQAMIDAALEG